MLINKNNFIESGIDKKTAALYQSMLGRMMPSVTIRPTGDTPGVRGHIPTRNFELSYALKISEEMANSTHPHSHGGIWGELNRTLQDMNLRAAVKYAIEHPTIAIHAVAVDFGIPGEALHDAYTQAKQENRC